MFWLLQFCLSPLTCWVKDTPEPATGEPYEGGIVSEGSARVRFFVRYYLVAAFFVVFDMEAAFLFAWAVAARELGWTGYCEVLLFVGELLWPSFTSGRSALWIGAQETTLARR